MQIYPQGPASWVLALEPGDEAIGKLMEFAQEQGITAARFWAVGAFRRATIAYFERDRKQYRHHELEEQVEVCSLMGNVTQHEGKPKIHGHVVLGLPDGTTRGGHLVSGDVWPTLEVALDALPGPLERMTDPESGLPLLNR